MYAAPPGFVVTGLDAVPTEEGGEASFTVTLASKPAGSVVLDVTSSQPTEVMIIAEDPSPITTSDWFKPRRYWAIGLDDESEDGDAKVSIAVQAAPGSDPAYVALPAKTLDTENLDDERTLTVMTPFIKCDGPATEDIFDGRVIGLLYDRAFAKQLQAQVSPPLKPEELVQFDVNDPAEDDRVFSENSDGMYFRLRTLHVVLRNTFNRSLTDKETLALQQSYSRAAHRIQTASHGMAVLDFDQVALDTEFGWDSFVDDDDTDLWVTAKFVDYAKLAFALAFTGYDYDEYDMISVSLAFTDDPPFMVRGAVANSVPPPKFDFGVPYTNPDTWKNDHTMTTLQYTTDPLSALWSDIYVHEMTHNLEWMLEYANYTEMRNPDDLWWAFTYLYDDMLDMFWARPKHELFYIPSTWGTIEKQTPTHIVEMSCPSDNTYRERRVHCPFGVTCDVGCQCKKGEGKPPPKPKG